MDGKHWIVVPPAACHTRGCGVWIRTAFPTLFLWGLLVGWPGAASGPCDVSRLDKPDLEALRSLSHVTRASDGRQLEAWETSRDGPSGPSSRDASDCEPKKARAERYAQT